MDDSNNKNGNGDNGLTRVFGANEFGFEGRARPEDAPAAKQAAPAAEDAATLDPAELARRFDALGEE